MRKLDRPNINTKQYWDDLYRDHARGGWLHKGWLCDGVIVTPNLDKFLYPPIAQLAAQQDEVYGLEIGGGDGFGTNILSEAFPDIRLWNVDISETAIARGREKYPHITHICHDILTPLPIEITFDFLLCQEVIEHLENPVLGVANMMKLLREGGLAVFTFPLNEEYSGAAEHLWHYDYTSVRELFFIYTNEITLCKLITIETNLHGCVKFWKT